MLFVLAFLGWVFSVTVITIIANPEEIISFTQVAKEAQAAYLTLSHNLHYLPQNVDLTIEQYKEALYDYSVHFTSNYLVPGFEFVQSSFKEYVIITDPSYEVIDSTPYITTSTVDFTPLERLSSNEGGVGGLGFSKWSFFLFIILALAGLHWLSNNTTVLAIVGLIKSELASIFKPVQTVFKLTETVFVTMIQSCGSVVNSFHSTVNYLVTFVSTAATGIKSLFFNVNVDQSRAGNVFMAATHQDILPSVFEEVHSFDSTINTAETTSSTSYVQEEITTPIVEINNTTIDTINNATSIKNFVPAYHQIDTSYTFHLTQIVLETFYLDVSKGLEERQGRSLDYHPTMIAFKQSLGNVVIQSMDRANRIGTVELTYTPVDDIDQLLSEGLKKVYATTEPSIRKESNTTAYSHSNNKKTSTYSHLESSGLSCQNLPSSSSTFQVQPGLVSSGRTLTI